MNYVKFADNVKKAKYVPCESIGRILRQCTCAHTTRFSDFVLIVIEVEVLLPF